MTPTQLAERIEQARDALLASIEKATEARDTFAPHSEHWSAVNGIIGKSQDLMNRAAVCAGALVRYADPDFYAELPPSLALEDRGAHAKNKLEQAFPE